LEGGKEAFRKRKVIEDSKTYSVCVVLRAMQPLSSQNEDSAMQVPSGQDVPTLRLSGAEEIRNTKGQMALGTKEIRRLGQTE